MARAARRVDGDEEAGIRRGSSQKGKMRVASLIGPSRRVSNSRGRDLAGRAAGPGPRGIHHWTMAVP